jgi:hypothetical protein
MACEARRLRARLYVLDLGSGPAIEEASLLEQSWRDIDPDDLTAATGEQPCETTGSGAEIHDAHARAHDAPVYEAIEQLARKVRTMSGVVTSGSAKVWEAARHRLRG